MVVLIYKCNKVYCSPKYKNKLYLKIIIFMLTYKPFYLNFNLIFIIVNDSPNAEEYYPICSFKELHRSRTKTPRLVVFDSHRWLRCSCWWSCYPNETNHTTDLLTTFIAAATGELTWHTRKVLPRTVKLATLRYTKPSSSHPSYILSCPHTLTWWVLI